MGIDTCDIMNLVSVVINSQREPFVMGPTGICYHPSEMRDGDRVPAESSKEHLIINYNEEEQLTLIPSNLWWRYSSELI